MTRPRIGALSAEQTDTLRMISEGKTELQIAALLGISPSTVKTRTLRIRRLLKAEDRAHAVGIAYRAGILSPEPISPEALLLRLGELLHTPVVINDAGATPREDTRP